MLKQNEFYFIRHGQTDHNLAGGRGLGDQSQDIPLNATGREQAVAIRPIIAELPVLTVCSSPLRRAQETREIITPNLKVDHHAIEDLGECGARTWNAMASLGMYYMLPDDQVARPFIDRVKRGIGQALEFPGPVLIVAHGGVHWALCCLLQIKEHDWAVENCLPVHFKTDSSGSWTAQKLVNQELRCI